MFCLCLFVWGGHRVGGVRRGGEGRRGTGDGVGVGALQGMYSSELNMQCGVNIYKIRGAGNVGVHCICSVMNDTGKQPCTP